MHLLRIVSVVLLLTSNWCRDLKGKSLLLRTEVEVRRNIVYLSDLLPGDMSFELAVSARRIQIAHAPQIGSDSSIPRATILERLAAFPDLASRLKVPEQVVVRRHGYEIGADAITLALTSFFSQQGWDVTLPGNARLAAAESVTPHPALEVSGYNWDYRTHQMQFRVRCRNSHECQSFLVGVALPRRPRPTGEESRPKAKLDRHMLQRTSLGPVLAEAGKPATLLVEGDGIRLTLPVLCLDRGRISESVRARDRVHRRQFTAIVIGPHLLRANF